MAAFLPVILVLFFFLSLLEDTGYLARVAFVTDCPLRRLGLSGQSAVPLLLGFGCSVPAVLAARTLPARRDRVLTILLTPWMSCSAKAPVYAAFAAAFFPQRSALVFLALYALGIGTAVGAAKLLCCMGRQEAAPFVMELPDYRWPDAHSVLRRMRQRTREFLARAFTVILAASIGVWVLRTFTPAWRVAANANESLLAAAGRVIAPVFQPLGFGDWRAATALVTGLLAKETVLSTLGVLLGSIAGNIVDRFAPFTPQFLSLIALIATMAVLLSFLFVFRESDLIALTEEPESEAENAEDRALGSSSDAPPTASDSPRPRFQDRCLEVAAAFELSPKETEVMILFAKGRSAARIQEELFISKGTVSTHLRHIYQKMDVHSKQEMLDVIEGVTRE